MHFAEFLIMLINRIVSYLQRDFQRVIASSGVFLLLVENCAIIIKYVAQEATCNVVRSVSGGSG